MARQPVDSAGPAIDQPQPGFVPVTVIGRKSGAGREGPDIRLCLTSAPVGQIRSFHDGGFLDQRNHQGAKMNQKSETSTNAAGKLVKGIRRRTREQDSVEEKIRIVSAGLHGEQSIAALCRRDGISKSLYPTWSKEFLEAGKQRLAGDTTRQATSPEGKDLRSESAALKEVVADLTLEHRLLRKSVIEGGEYEAGGIPPRKSRRSSAPWKPRICRFAGRLPCSGTVARPVTAGTTDGRNAGLTHSGTQRLTPGLCGTARRMRRVPTSSNLP
ncbi:MAG: hypothetical protein EP318_00300 [Rhodobacteraceae bacterium]|nr:MAG: hypothetical protein EP318_00300 [Paracoccaceae bacterium]